MKHATQTHLPDPGTGREKPRLETASIELWGAHYELPDIELAIAEEVRELREAIARLEKRLAGLPSAVGDRQSAADAAKEVTK